MIATISPQMLPFESWEIIIPCVPNSLLLTLASFVVFESPSFSIFEISLEGFYNLSHTFKQSILGDQSSGLVLTTSPNSTQGHVWEVSVDLQPSVTFYSLVTFEHNET